ncbi:MAG: hypothetical protein L0H79_19670 [Intrasporangium sp.]|uniref:M20/M25/M40 family metallo-hydrolase n=1 Tax=Intrasporangium sp. TaxID=1925024 RepID=UPI002648DC49|nr:M20/M25/M40 family metallo-hydrolase [Intrasporangium sp.]MDN5797944.1 hypothetical protein [Intrasporangium sp.]
MHACGHDVHTTALWGRCRCCTPTATTSSRTWSSCSGPEASVGAKWMIEGGVLEVAGRRPDAAFGLHVFSGMLPHGQFATRPGAFMAGCDDMRAVVTGQGGQGSSPHLAKDPVPVAYEITVALQTHVNRRYSWFEPIVLTVGKIAAGTDSAVIPATGERPDDPHLLRGDPRPAPVPRSRDSSRGSRQRTACQPRSPARRTIR